MIGLNAPADARLSAQFFDLNKSHITRAVLKPEYDLTPWVAEHHQLGMSVLGVIARESLYGPDATPEPGAGRWSYSEWLESIANASGAPSASVELAPGAMSYDDAARFYAERYGDTLDALQIGNEADHVSPSSWSMTPQDLNSLLFAFNAHFEDTTIVGPGLVSGIPSYLDGVDLDLVDAIAVHPYGQRPGNIGDWSELPGNFGTVGNLLDSYRPYGKPIWITEVGVSTTECSPEFQARYCEAILKALNIRTDVPVAMWFCADDAMVQEFGLFDVNGSPKPSAAAFMRAASSTAPVDPYKFVLGFKQVADANPGIVGRPLENEYGFVEGLSLQRTSNGLLIWANVSGGHMGFIDFNTGTRYRWNPSAGLVKVLA